MKIIHSFLLAVTLALLSNFPSFSMQEEFDCEKFVKSFIPKNSSAHYIEQTVLCYEDMLLLGKQSVLHDDPSVGKTNTVVQEYGCSYPPIPHVQKYLLEFCANSPHTIWMIDVGAGFGIDSLCALLTKNVELLVAYEKQEKQCQDLKKGVEQSIHNIFDSEASPLNKFMAKYMIDKFMPTNQDFLTVGAPLAPHKFDILNINKVIHFFDPTKTEIFVEKAKFVLKTAGRLFLTCLTPTPDSAVEIFMNSQANDSSPGYVFYKFKTEIHDVNTQPRAGKRTILEVRKPTSTEKGAHFFQENFLTSAAPHVISHHVRHYHTPETIAKALGDGFRILKKEITCFDDEEERIHLLSIVAEKL